MVIIKNNRGAFMPGQNKGTVLITGASSGIGKACALLLDRSGYQVFAGVRSIEAGERLEAESSDRLSTIILDITDPKQIKRSVETVTKSIESEKGLHALINNAGVSKTNPVELVPLDELRELLEVNAVGQIAVTKAFLPLLRKNSGRIIFTGSVSCWLVLPQFGAYSASKYALRALVNALRIELRPWNIPVSIIDPGVVNTPIIDKIVYHSREMDTLSEADSSTEFYSLKGPELRDITKKIRPMAMPPEKIARFIKRCLEARKPKAQYLIGVDSHLLAFMARFLPNRLIDWILWIVYK
jgi:NAD(P)-dependent dehydrogenase (short-subunit alcohol dehydrogenase family)